MYNAIMIHSFYVKNFYSFKDEAEVDFTVNDNAPKTNGYMTGETGQRISKVAAVVGGNAAGKTNLLKALPFLKWMIVSSYGQDPDKKIPIRTCAATECKDIPAELSVTFEIKSKLYTYFIKVDRDRIWEENLKVSSQAKEKLSTKTLFGRIWNEKKDKYTLISTNYKLPKGADEEALLRSNASIISAAIRFSHKESKQIADYWREVRTTVDESQMGFNLRFYHLEKAVTFYQKHTDIKERASKLMERFDLGLRGFDIENASKLDEDSYEATFKHGFGDDETEMLLEYESLGTQQLFLLLTYILAGLKAGSMVIIDELDVHLHPDMQVELMELFTDPELNPNNAQLLFSTQSPAILNTMNKYQIFLTEKNESGFSEAWRLDEVDGVRSDESYGNKYLAGAYGAVPRL